MAPTVLMFLSSLACVAAFVLLMTLPPGLSSAAAVAGSMLVTIVLSSILLSTHRSDRMSVRLTGRSSFSSDF